MKLKIGKVFIVGLLCVLSATTEATAGEQGVFNMAVKNTIEAIKSLETNIQKDNWCIFRKNQEGYKNKEVDIVKDAILSNQLELYPLLIISKDGSKIVCLDTVKTETLAKKRAKWIKNFLLKKEIVKKFDYLNITKEHYGPIAFFSNKEKVLKNNTTFWGKQKYSLPQKVAKNSTPHKIKKVKIGYGNENNLTQINKAKDINSTSVKNNSVKVGSIILYRNKN